MNYVLIGELIEAFRLRHLRPIECLPRVIHVWHSIGPHVLPLLIAILGLNVSCHL